MLLRASRSSRATFKTRPGSQARSRRNSTNCRWPGQTPTTKQAAMPRASWCSRSSTKAIAFSGGCFLVGAPFGPRGSVAWVPALGLSAVVGSCLLRTYHTSTTTQQHNPYSNSVFDINPISPTLHSNFSFHPTHPTIRIISRILGDLSPSVLDFLS